MKFYSISTVVLALLALTAGGAAAQVFSPSTQGSTTPFTPVQNSQRSTAAPVQNSQAPAAGTGSVNTAEGLFTMPVLEPNGAAAVCMATNLDTVARDLTAQIFDARGADVTQTNSCRANIGAGATCNANATFANNSPLRCVIGTSGSAQTLRGGMTTSSGPFPFTNPANLTVPAE